tara:strand:+ start:166 stop:291 length:126 start_codon:yes stop_codon:yes gene_type:complete
VFGWVEIVRALEGFRMSYRVYEIIKGKKKPSMKRAIKGKRF